MPPNGGRAGLLMFLTDNKLNLDDQKRLACAISFRTFIKAELILLKGGEYNKICLRRRMLENGTIIEEKYGNQYKDQSF
jgi:hypothetical protein